MAQAQPFTARKAIISVLMVGWLVALLWGLEYREDEKDYQRTDELIAGQHAPWSLARELLARHPDNALSCERKKIISSFRGLVDVTCEAPGVDPYRFEVDLIRRQIRGRDPRSQEVMDAVERKRQLSNDAGR